MSKKRLKKYIIEKNFIYGTADKKRNRICCRVHKNEFFPKTEKTFG
jgi:hypothetical protein